MASIQETTAVSIRKGNTAENDAFTGILGEVVADLGVDGTGVDIGTTLRLHNGVTQGGIRIARADLTNVTSKTLASGRELYGDKNLAYADLSNIEELVNTDQKNTVRNYMHSYGLALNSQIDDLDTRKANVTMDNVDTATLATGEGETGKHAGKNLAYADASNINAKYLADAQYRSGDEGDKALAYADASNINTTGLTNSNHGGGPTIARADLSNVNNTNFKNKANAINTEYTINKVEEIDPSSAQTSVQYPTTGAVIDYVREKMDDLDYMNLNLDNATSWKPLYADITTPYIYNNDANNFTAVGSNFTEVVTRSENNVTKNLPAIAPTDYVLTNISTNLQLAVYSLSTSDDPNRPYDADKPFLIRLYPEFGTTQLTSQRITFINSAGSTATGTLTCTAHPSLSGIYHYSLGLSIDDVVGPDGDEETSSGWNANDSTDINEVPCYKNINNIEVTPVLTLQIDTVSSGHITSFEFDPKTSSEEIAAASNITVGHPFTVTITKDQVTGEKISTATIQSGNNAKFDLLTKTDSDIPSIGGAGLLKFNLENLPGMKAIDIAENRGAAWSINKVKSIPDITATDIDPSEYERIATVGQVWNCARSIDSRITFRQWS